MQFYHSEHIKEKSFEFNHPMVRLPTSSSFYWNEIKRSSYYLHGCNIFAQNSKGNQIVSERLVSNINITKNLITLKN